MEDDERHCALNINGGCMNDVITSTQRVPIQVLPNLHRAEDKLEIFLMKSPNLKILSI
jgi:predicted ATPase